MKRRNFFPKSLTVLALLMLLFANFAPSGYARTEAIHYVALGDSLAAGQTPSNQIDKSYTDYLVEHLEAQHYEVYFNNYGKSGYTTAQILSEIRTNLEQKEAIQSADVITINAGANDIIRSAINLETQEIDLESAQISLATVEQNFREILAEIQAINSDANVYVMGYYNAFSHFDTNQNYPLVLLATHMLNSTIQEVAKEYDATFVPTFDAMEENIKDYLENPFDIHPNLDGYQTLASAMWKEMRFDAPFDWTEINKNKVELTENIPLNKTWTVTFNTEIDEETITDESIYIVDSTFSKVPVKFDWLDDKTILTITPENSYNSDETYHLYIADSVQSIAGKQLKNKVIMKFSTVNEKEGNTINP